MNLATLPSNNAVQPLDLPLKAALGRLTHGISPSAVTSAFEDWAAHLALSPGKQLALAESAWRKALQWSLCVQQSLAGGPPLVEPAPQDKRFTPPDWQRAPHCWTAQAFLLTQQWWHEATTGVRGVEHHHQAVVEFLARQWLDMGSPSNFIATNPELLRRTVTTGGANLVDGARNWWRDAVAVITDASPEGIEHFKVGQEVATTPGQVVYRNRLIELIQYAPATRTVHPEPVLIVPSWIMKYYILDLSRGNSLVRFLVGQGHTVFMVSWKNPGGDERDLGFDDYLELGVFDALRAVRRAVPRHGIHLAGYCLGGTLAAIGAAALAGEGTSPLVTLTLLAAQTDFQQPGELGLFIDESQLAFLEDVTAERGYLDGRQMAGAFALINSKDLVWSKLVREYLMGGRTPLTDLRAWNADATRMPARMHGEYLRRLYLNNDLAEGRYHVHGRPVALKRLRVPTFALATERDHVSPWPSVYRLHLLADHQITFALTTGGHNVGVVNPPGAAATKLGVSHRIAVREPGAPYVDPETWAERAERRDGSWWSSWQQWLRRHSGARIAPPPPGGRGATRLVPLGDAPGTYVHGR